MGKGGGQLVRLFFCWINCECTFNSCWSWDAQAGGVRLSEVFTPPVSRLSEVFTPPVSRLSWSFHTCSVLLITKHSNSHHLYVGLVSGGSRGGGVYKEFLFAVTALEDMGDGRLLKRGVYYGVYGMTTHYISSLSSFKHDGICWDFKNITPVFQMAGLPFVTGLPFERICNTD